MLAVIGLGIAFPGDGSNLLVIGAGFLLFTLGGVCGLAGVWVLGGSRTPFPKPRPTAALVKHGIYSLMRHPLYTSVVLASLGWALIWQSVPALTAALVLAPFFDAKARREERWLAAKFPDYADYARKVRRFIPWVY
jgi:protein-S-isoprenylcysteine O-methyltransferase Ste14